MEIKNSIIIYFEEVYDSIIYHFSDGSITIHHLINLVNYKIFKNMKNLIFSACLLLETFNLANAQTPTAAYSFNFKYENAKASTQGLLVVYDTGNALFCVRHWNGYAYVILSTVCTAVTVGNAVSYVPLTDNPIRKDGTIASDYESDILVLSIYGEAVVTDIKNRMAEVQDFKKLENTYEIKRVVQKFL